MAEWFSRSLLLGAVCALTLLTSGCRPEVDATPVVTAAPKPSPTEAASGPPIASFPFDHAASTTPLIDDCRALLTEDVLAQLADTPLNAEGMGGGILPNSSRVCAWGHPGAAATYLVTTTGYSPHRAAVDELTRLRVDEDFTCYEPDAGLRCEKTWTHASLGVPQGRTLYYRDGVVIDTQYSNLSPRGYTAAVVAALWPRG